MRAVDAVAGQHHPDPEPEEPPAQDPARDRDAARGPHFLAGGGPERRMKDPSAVERIDGQQVEQREEEVQEGDNHRDLGDRIADGTLERLSDNDQRHERDGDKETRRRPRPRHQRFVGRTFRFPALGRRAAEEQQRHHATAHTASSRRDAVGELVRDDRREEQDGHAGGDGPSEGVAPVGLTCSELQPDADRDDREDHDPADMDPDLDAEDARDRDRAHAVVPSGRVATRSVSAELERVRDRADAINDTAMASRRIATTSTIAVSDQNCSGNSWTSRSWSGSKV